ncbi:MAG TPA: hypothetical protein VJ924_14235 [Alphaproteobacteria bacterium]|nr:hypothetical protein [Alphaproteobacteria bacterium]
MKRSIRRVIAAAVALMATACDDGPASNLSFTTTPDVWSITQSVGSAGPVEVAVLGEPFGDPSDRAAAIVADALGGAFTEPWLRFEPIGDKTNVPSARLVWLFDPAPGYNADLVCGATPPKTHVTGESPINIRAVFCNRKRPIAAVHGWMKRPADPNDGRFRILLQQMGRQALTGRG